MNIRKLARAGIASGLVLAATFGAAGSRVSAQAVSATFTSQIIYQNPTAVAGNMTAVFYPELDGNPAATISVPIAVPGFGAGSIVVGSVSGLASNFKGSAVLSADFDVIASTVQIPSTNATNRILATGFRAIDATSELYLASYLNGAFSTKSSFAVQNVEGQSVDVTASFQSVAGAVTVITATIPANASKFFDSRVAATIPGLPANFNGSVKVVAVRTGTATPAKVVGTVEEFRMADGRAYGYEAVPLAAGASTVYLPTAQCNYQPASQNSTTVFAFQNVSAFTVTATVHWLNTANAEIGTETFVNIGPSGKKSFLPCTAPGVATGFLGSGYISVSGGGKGVAIAKLDAPAPGPGFLTGFLGQGQGSAKLAFPYMRNPASTPISSDIGSSVSVQNIGTDIITGGITLAFYDLNGNVVRTGVSSATLVNGAKFSVALGAAVGGIAMSGAVPTTSWEGSMVVTGPVGSQLIAVARHQAPTYKFWTEDYNGVFIQ